MESIIGKVYYISSSESNLVYIGSTTATLNRRFQKHYSDLKRFLEDGSTSCSSFEILLLGDCDIELIEEIELEESNGMSACTFVGITSMFKLLVLIIALPLLSMLPCSANICSDGILASPATSFNNLVNGGLHL